MTGAWNISIGAGCTAEVLLGGGLSLIRIYGPDGTVRRRARGPWTAAAARKADAELRHIVDRVIAAGAPRPA